MLSITPAAIARRNTRFLKLSPAARRVAVCRDALRLLTGPDRSKIKLRSDYGSFYNSRGHEIHVDQTTLCKLGTPGARAVPTCEVCAKGLLFVSAIRFTNCFNSTIFSESQADLIEAAFEGWTVAHPEVRSFHDKHYGLSRDNRTELMKAILRNIIRNKGTFKP